MEDDKKPNDPNDSHNVTPPTGEPSQSETTPLDLRKAQTIPPQPTGAPQATQSDYSAPQAPQDPPSAYSAPQGYGAPPGGTYPSTPGQPYLGPQAGPQQGYSAPQHPAPGYAYVPRPKDMTVAYAWAYFLGLFGAHKFYMGQGMQGGIYLGITLASFVLSFLGIGFLITVFMLFMMYADIRTMPEQIERSNSGEQFNNLFEFLKKAFR